MNWPENKCIKWPQNVKTLISSLGDQIHDNRLIHASLYPQNYTDESKGGKQIYHIYDNPQERTL